MLHFLRKIRHDLISNSKTFRYLKYATGEIILVVLGILIALYINNQNEKRKNSELFDQILVEVETELIHNIELTKGSIDYLHSFDSVYSIVLFDELSPENFENDTLFSFRNLPWVTNDIQKESFEKLNTIDAGINVKQDSLYASLKYLYVSDRFKYGQELEKYSLDLHLKILESREEFSWYVNTLLGQPYTQDEISYYIDNPLYRNHIATVSKLTLSQFKVHLTAWEQILLSNYKRVYDYLEEENVQHSDSLLFEYDPEKFMHFIGKYRWKGTTGFTTEYTKEISSKVYFEIELVDNKIIATIKGLEDVEAYSFGEIIPVSNSYFRVKKFPESVHINIIFNDNNEVSGITVRGGTWITSAQKIE